MRNQPKIILIALLGSLVAAGLYLFVLKPTLDKVVDLNKQAIVKKTDLKQLEEQITIYKNSQRDLSQASGKEIIAESLLPRENLQVAIVEIEAGAAKLKLSESMVIQDETQPATKAALAKKGIISGKSFLDEISYSVQIESDFKEMIDFLSYLEHLPHFTEITRITLQSAPGSSDVNGVFIHSGRILSSIDSVFFVQKQ